jgi:26S proteasome regulatory subunit N10
MPLEATMLIIDNSEFMRNGDYQPTRFDAQSDAVNTIFQSKIDSNPENTVGIMTMAGKGCVFYSFVIPFSTLLDSTRPEVLVTHTKDLGQILKAIHTAHNSISGQIDIPTSIAVAQLALKHRENKNLRQRIIVFVASPLQGPAADEKNIIKLAKKLKKNNVAVDVVAFGDGIEQGEKTILKVLTDGASSGDNSYVSSY